MLVAERYVFLTFLFLTSFDVLVFRVICNKNATYGIQFVSSLSQYMSLINELIAYKNYEVTITQILKVLIAREKYGVVCRF